MKKDNIKTCYISSLSIILLMVINNQILSNNNFIEINKYPAICTNIVYASEDEVLDYWTEERMRNAEPMPFPKVTKKDKRVMGDGGQGKPGKLFISPSQPPQNETEKVPGKSDLNTWESFETTRVDDLEAWPYHAIGKLFFGIGGKDYVCSAWTFKDYSIFTAGHCIYDPDTSTWATYVIYKPQYADGQAPRQWTMNKLCVPKGWANGGSFALDVAAAESNEPIAPVTGKLSIIANSEPALRYYGIGYPLYPLPGYDFNGERMWQSKGNYFRTHNYYILGMYNNMTPGSSGGPWLISGGQYINGLNSFRYDEDDKMYSPYFGSAVIRLFSEVR